MDNILVYIIFIISLVILIKGGDYIVDSCLWVAKISKIPPVIVGATLVSLATTLPEILVSIISVIHGADSIGLAVGNALGSKLFNVSCIIGISAFYSPSMIPRKSVLFKCILLAVATFLLIFFILIGDEINFIEGLILIILFLFYILINIWSCLIELKVQRNFDKKFIKVKINNFISIYEKKQYPLINIIKLLLGTFCLAIGAHYLVDNGVIISRSWNISTEKLGLTFISIGTSLSELITTILSIRKKEASLGLGNILGSNIINATLQIGACAMIVKSLPITNLSKFVCAPFLFVTTLILILPILIKERTYVLQGFVLLISYLSFVGIILVL